VGVDAFGIEKEFLHDLMREVQEGRAQLPEFQRGWVWPDRGIASLLASISLGYPVGTVMMLRTGGDVRFKHRVIQGVVGAASTPERLVLDGQQRLTSLYQALMRSDPVETQDVRKRPTSGWFYIDMQATLDDRVDREEAFRFLPKDRVVRNFRGEAVEDYSTSSAEFTSMMFPVNRVFSWPQWQIDFQQHWQFDTEKIQAWTKFYLDVVQRFEKYQLPVIELGRDTPRQAVCQVFEKVNTGGVTLTVFELLTATFAADEFDLRQDWIERKTQWAAPEYRVLRDVVETDFLQAVTLLATRAKQAAALRANEDLERAPRIGARRTDMLNLSLDEYSTWAPVVVDGLKRSARFLHREHFFESKFLPYGAQVIPLAAILAALGVDGETNAAQDKLARWYWCGVLGELYGGTTETRFARDLPEVVAWVRGAQAEPRTVQEAQFDAGRLMTLRTRGSAAYKGIYALLLKRGGVDWRTGETITNATYFDEAIDVHHVFPRAWCDRKGADAKIYNSIINKTPLSARTNRIIGGYAPSDYLPRLASSAQTDINAIEKNVGTHLINIDLLKADAFEDFVAARRRELLGVISGAMGKPVQGDELMPAEGDDALEELDDTDDL